MEHSARSLSPAALHASEVAELQKVIRLIADRLDDVAPAVPMRNRGLIPNALLNVAVERFLEADAPEVIARILHRLADLVLAGRRPEGSQAYPLTRHDA